MFRRQLPVYSPLPFAAVAATFGTADPRRAVAAQLQTHYGSAGVCLTDSGTSALMLALRIAQQRRPDAVCALPGFGCFDLATAAIGAGVTVALYDVDPRTLLPDLTSLAQVLAAGAAAVVVVHLFGNPVPLAPIQQLAGSAGALLIEDAAQGIGGAWAGRPLGAAGDVGVLSFGRGKGVTGGAGGALLINAPLLLPWQPTIEEGRASRLKSALALTAQWAMGRPTLYGIPASIPWLGLGETPFHAPHEPVAMSPFSARALTRTWPLAFEEAEQRRANVQSMLRSARARGAVPPVAAEGVPGWLRLPVHGPEHGFAGTDAAAVLGILPSYPIALDQLPALERARRVASPLPGATRLARHLWTAPTHSRLSASDGDRVADWIESHAA